ncbi:TPA: hypothetical protein ACY3HI_001482 [Citrobacter braakii]|uniref:hypothetical protein n=1 Tax=Citrobacter europaeus TaxID=1914243 RepID=UPI0039C17CFB
MRVQAPLQPNEMMIQAGITELFESFPSLEDSELDDDELSDAITFIWQAMYAEIK